MLNTIMHPIGITRRKNAKVNVIPSIMQNIKKSANVSEKLISDEIFLEKRKRYFGTFTFENIAELPSKEPIPPFVASEKKEKTIFPQKRYIV